MINILKAGFICLLGFHCFTMQAQSLLQATGSANNFNITYPAKISGTIPSGMMVTFQSNQSITGSASITLNTTFGPYTILKNFNQPLQANDIKTNHFVTVIYDGTNWQMLSENSIPAINGASSAGGDLSGTYSNPTVSKLQGNNVFNTAPSNGQALMWNGGLSRWEPQNIAASGTASGDLSGIYPSPTVAKINGTGVSASPPSAGQFLYSNGSLWLPGSIGGDLTGSFPNPTIANNAVNLATKVSGVLPLVNGGTGQTFFTQGAMLFSGLSSINSNSSKIFWDNTNFRLGIGTNTPTTDLHVVGNSSVSGIGYFGTIAGLALNGASAGSVVTVDGAGRLGFGPAGGGGGLSGSGQVNGIAYYTAANTLTSNSSSLAWNGNVLSINGVRFYAFNSGTNSNVIIGTDVANTTFAGANNNIMGYQAGFNISTGNRNNVLGYQAGNGLSTGASNNVFGYQAGYSLGVSNYNNLIGYQAGYSANNAAAQYNNYFGYTTGYYNVSGSSNNYFGNNAGGSYNAGDWNVFIGYQAGYKGGVSTNNGSDNIFIGKNSGSINTTGTQNIAIGSGADVISGALTNAIAIGYGAVAGASNTMVLGGAVNPVNVGIGTTNPQASLEIAGPTAKIIFSPSTAGGTNRVFAAANQGANTLAGDPLTISAGNSGNLAAGNVGGNLSLNAGGANGSGVHNGGNIILTPGVNTGAGFFGRVILNEGHLTSNQATAPTVVAQSGAGTGATCTLSNATDVAGSISLTTGSASYGTGAQCIITFNKSYSVAPIVILTPANNIAGQQFSSKQIYVTSTTTTFTINFNTAASVSQAFILFYQIIETQ